MQAKTNSLQRRRLFVSRFSSCQPAIFLDRDGVLIEDQHYLSDPDKVKLCPGAKLFMSQAALAKWPVIIVTNQSGIARGYFSWNDYELVTDEILRLLGNGPSVAAIYSNGHGPDAAEGGWRKPGPGMLLEAARELNLDLKHSILVGDRLSDLIAGERAGVSKLCHVKSGHGASERSSVEAWSSMRPAQQTDEYKFELFLFDSLDQVAFALQGLTQ